MRPLTLASLLLLGLPATAYAAESWAETAGNDKDYAASKAICRTAQGVKLPTGGGAPPQCDSSALLYGIGRPADPVAARACALREMTDHSDDPGRGAATLATIYANGSGVPRNYDVAIAYACLIDGAPAEMDGRIKHLAKLRADGPGKAPFDVCDDVTSGLMEGVCAERDGELADGKRDVAIASLTAGLAPAGKAAFGKLQAAETTFVKASADNEVDMSGTARGAMVVASQQKHQNAFAAIVRAILDGKLPPTGSQADKQLNATYGKVMALKETSGLGTVEKKGIKATQLTWLRYRDAFVAFAKVAAPGLAPATLAAALTEARTKDLAALLQDT